MWGEYILACCIAGMAPFVNAAWNNMPVVKFKQWRYNIIYDWGELNETDYMCGSYRSFVFCRDDILGTAGC
ncbi:MAG: hypothetical protein K6C05_02350 [Anaerovibrio sp.]|uniref:hypothetical protein n=1 Tax=Anaerovibrio sp. TaxID=1872532 RepID=UPI0025F022D3|nr:hypothetical protein [Anaerovibrio sp.]MCR5175670.1 hypothetical protein [Anaerovibrio sp.]